MSLLGYDKSFLYDLPRHVCEEIVETTFDRA